MKPAPIIKPIEITFAQSYTGVTVDIGETDIFPNSGNKIHIPAGIRDGNTIIISNNSQGQGQSQEIHLHINIQNDGPFMREDNNLLFKKKITLKESLCGFKFQIDHLNGNKLSFNMNAIVYPGAKQVIKNLGFPGGDFIIDFEVEFPTHLTQEQKDAISNVL